MAHRGNTERHAARLAAVQAIYQMELTGNDAESVAQEFCEHRFGEIERGTDEPDENFFSDLVRGVPHHQVEIDRAIAEGLSENWKLQRIDSILRAILRAGIYELVVRKDVPVKVVIDEYLDIAHAFFGGEEPAFVNALLDRVAHKKRAAEFGETPADDELRF
ncbi:MAG TPA: transcription antitermination factor NusB [Rhizomicrobium sp.]|jgi:N utilization substance protein B|nr:transcription antitermination factor NusB [Rhizomicrobium sp.]